MASQRLLFPLVISVCLLSFHGPSSERLHAMVMYLCVFKQCPFATARTAATSSRRCFSPDVMSWFDQTRETSSYTRTKKDLSSFSHEERSPQQHKHEERSPQLHSHEERSSQHSHKVRLPQNNLKKQTKVTPPSDVGRRLHPCSWRQT
jgi:hypothetical protein